MSPSLPARGGLRLKPLQVPGFSELIGMRDGRLTLGRAEDNDVRFGDVFPAVSTHHARLEVVAGELWIEDVGSRNGTIVNGESIDRVRLAAGDVVQLGPVGPRFLVVSETPLSETMFVDPRKVRAGQLSEERVTELVASRAKSQLVALGVVGGLAVTALIWWGMQLSERGSSRSDELERTLSEQDTARQAELAESREVIDELRRVDRQRQEQLEQFRSERAAYVEELEGTIERHETEAQRLQERLALLEATDGASNTEIARLEEDISRARAEVELAREEFAHFDPVNLQQARLSGVARVSEAVVLLETSLTLVDTDTGAVLHMSSRQGPNFDDEGVPWSMDATGSGFCVSPEGWILTNGHVVRPPPDHELVLTAMGKAIEARIVIEAVFSNTATRHSVEVVDVAEDVDLALVRIEPFEGMPYLADFDLDVRPPGPGADVYLLGFPLGHFALQEGNTVIASTFRGILSRNVGGNLQVDAGVHPGNSGGPITDASGNVIGVVYSVQATPDQMAVYTIGYGIPIREAREIWPPAVAEEAEDGDESIEDPGKEDATTIEAGDG